MFQLTPFRLLRQITMCSLNHPFKFAALCVCIAIIRYGELLDTFIKFSANEPGTHVSQVAQTMGDIMAAHRPMACYKVGIDSKAAPIVGLLPTAIRETVVKYSMYKILGKS